MDEIHVPNWVKLGARVINISSGYDNSKVFRGCVGTIIKMPSVIKEKITDGHVKYDDGLKSNHRNIHNVSIGWLIDNFKPYKHKCKLCKDK